MSRAWQFILCAATLMTASAVSAEEPAAPASAKISTLTTTLTTNLPPVPVVQSPVIYFRQLLAMSPADRVQSLTNRPAASRQKILDKVDEYLALSPEEREIRLRATEFHWYLSPLLRTPRDQRGARVAALPAEYRDLAQSRLAKWDVLSPELQKEFLANDRTLHYFLQNNNGAATNSPAQKAAEQFDQFLSLTPDEKQQILGTLSATERAQMEKTLQAFQTLPVKQRVICLRNYAKFVGMSAQERAEFLKNADSWSKMSSQERQTWRDLVAHAPLWPPLPGPTMPPMPVAPHLSPKISKSGGMVTNEN